MRAYANGDYYGDSGYTATGELRYALGVPGLELAAFVDVGAAKNLATRSNEIDHLAGWGVGLRYSKPNDWYAQFDFARKINGLRTATAETTTTVSGSRSTKCSRNLLSFRAPTRHPATSNTAARGRSKPLDAGTSPA